MKKLLFILFAIFTLWSCSDEQDVVPNPFVIAFNEVSINYLTIEGTENIQLVFSEPAKQAGFVKIKVEEKEVKYGTDYTTLPEVENGEIVLPFNRGDKSLSFQFTNLIEKFSVEDRNKSIDFEITQIDYKGESSIQGYTSCVISFQPRLGGVLTPDVGGPTEPNQVYVSLSTGESTIVKRESWDLGFYAGEDFRVILNSSLYMAVKALDGTDIDAFTKSNIDPSLFEVVKIGTFKPENAEYVDDPTGDLKKTAIAEVSSIEADNKVYLVNLGSGPKKDANAPVGSAPVAGRKRGWKKIRVLQKDGGYLLQYANINEKTHKEIFIPKTPEYNFNFFSFEKESTVMVQPPKKDWDICFTVFTNLISGYGSYGYSDFVVNNVLGGAQAFSMNSNEDGVIYEDYKLNISEAEQKLSQDQRAIGSSWRNVFKDLFEEMFYVMRDTQGNWYKIKFLAFKNDEGVRGHIKLEYARLEQ